MAQTPLSQLSKMKRSFVVDEETWDSVTGDFESREAASFSTPERPEQKLKVSREAATFSSLETPEQKLKAELESTKFRERHEKSTSGP